MDLLRQTFDYAVADRGEFVRHLFIHLSLSGAALTLSLLLCLPLAIWIARHPHSAEVVLNAINTLRVVPSLAILFLVLPYLGLGFGPALVALTLLACPPLLLNSYAAFRGVNPSVIEAARGMGLSEWQLLFQIEFPLAMPVIMTGIRMATVEVIASASLAAFISAGGLGNYILRGFSVNRPHVMLVGAIPIALLALLAESLLAALQRRLAIPDAR